MARLNLVKKAQKQKVCNVCGKPIEVGQPYKFMEPKFRGQVNAHMQCEIPLNMVSSSKMVAIWEQQKNCSKTIDDATEPADIAQALRDLAETARGVSEEYQESADNQREYFPESSVADDNEQKAQDLESWADELESVAGDAENCEPEEVDIEKEEAETDENFGVRKEEAEGKAKETALEEAREYASITEECPC